MTKHLTEVAKVRGIVNITEPYETKFLCNSLKDWEKLGVNQFIISVPDFTASPNIEQLQSAIQFIEQLDDNPGMVYVHCKAGRSRSAPVVAFYLMSTKGYSSAETVEEIKKHRSHIVIRSRQSEILNNFYEFLQRSNQ